MERVTGTSSKLGEPLRGREGFTLVELMVVVTLLVLLLAMLMPALQKAMEAARVTQCASNLRSQGVAWRCYISDNAETMLQYDYNTQWCYGGKQPAGVETLHVGQPPTPMKSYRALNPYVQLPFKKVTKAPVFQCPSDHGIGAVAKSSSSFGYTCYDWFGNSYLANWLVMEETDPATCYPAGFYNVYEDGSWHLIPNPFRMPQLKLSPSDVLLAGDPQWLYAIYNTSAVWAYYHNDTDKVNLLFMDGHVRFTQMQRGVDATGDYSITPYTELPQTP